VGVCPRDFNLHNVPLGMEGDTWAMSMSPGPEKAKGPRRIEISGRLMADDIAILEIDLDEGWMTVSLDGVIRAHFTDLHQVKERVILIVFYVFLTSCRV